MICKRRYIALSISVGLLFAVLIFCSCGGTKTIEVCADSPLQMRRYSGFVPEDMADAKFDRLTYDRSAAKASYYMQFLEIDASAINLDSLHKEMYGRVIDNIRTIPNMISMAEAEVGIEYFFSDRYGVVFYSRRVEPNIYRIYR